MDPGQGVKNGSSPYQLDLLPVVPAHDRNVRDARDFEDGDLVYYGPMPLYYGIGEIKHVTDAFVVVDFRGTGYLDVHQELFRREYLVHIPESKLDQL
ncbi:MAG: hypothetical protein BRD45_03675 [Bacteroidetes bacterium QS_8_64_10]|jgi:hypothetical protein|nr:MAG: hypothetical protein BRD45_03675 [Bacteroidetes bacterium QS_8_64_10]